MLTENARHELTEKPMIYVNWQDQLLTVRRLVFRRGHEFSFDTVLDWLAAGFSLEVADDRTEPQPGDFWLGCHPRASWGNADPNRIGWASLVETPLAIGVLKHAAVSEHQTDAPVFNATANALVFG